MVDTSKWAASVLPSDKIVKVLNRSLLLYMNSVKFTDEEIFRVWFTELKKWSKKPPHCNHSKTTKVILITKDKSRLAI